MLQDMKDMTCSWLWTKAWWCKQLLKLAKVSMLICVHVFVWCVYANICVVYIMHVYICTNVMYTHAHTYTHVYICKASQWIIHAWELCWTPSSQTWRFRCICSSRMMLFAMLFNNVVWYCALTYLSICTIFNKQLTSWLPNTCASFQTCASMPSSHHSHSCKNWAQLTMRSLLHCDNFSWLWPWRNVIFVMYVCAE